MPRFAVKWVHVVAVFTAAGGCASQSSAPGKPVQVSPVCSTIGRADAHSVLLKRENIVAVAPLSERPLVAKRNPLATIRADERAKRVGVRIVVKPAPGLTGEWLQTLVNCDRSLPAEEHATAVQCPFELANTGASVVSLGDAFAIDVTSKNPATVDELIRRAEALAQ